MRGLSIQIIVFILAIYLRVSSCTGNEDTDPSGDQMKQGRSYDSNTGGDQKEDYIRVDKELKNSTKSVGEKALLLCDIVANPSAKYTWYKDGKIIKNSDRIKLKKTNWGHKLRFSKLKMSDAGQYKCSATNRRGTASTSAHLFVLQSVNVRTNDNSRGSDEGSINPVDPPTNRGFCQQFSSSTCAKYLSQNDVFVKDEFHQSKTEGRIASFLVQASTTLNKGNSNCSQEVLKALCHYNFPVCSANDEPVSRICQNECSRLIDYRCKDFVAQLETKLAKHLFDLIPKCTNLPQDSSRDCAAPSPASSPAPVINQISEPPPECYDGIGRSYAGNAALTVNGKACLKWSNFAEYTSLNHSLCRNPAQGGNHQAPWCFVSLDGTSELCKLIPCKSKLLIRNVEMWFFIVCAVLGVFCVALIFFLVFCCWWRKSRCKYSALKQLKQSRHQSAHVISRHSMEMIARSNYLNHHCSVTDFPLHKIRFGEEVGEGRFGRVYRGDLIGLHNETSITPIVIKTLTVVESATDRKYTFQQEAYKLAELVHPNVMQLIGVSMKQPSPWCQIFELLSLNDLHENLVQQRCLTTSQYLPSASLRYETSEAFAIAGLDSSVKLQYAIEIAEGMQFLSSQNFVHGDLATRNILFGDDMQCKISDLASSREIYAADYYLLKPNTLVPVRWMPSEAILYGEFSVYSDIWSFGVLLWEIWTMGLQPYCGFSNTDVIELTRTRNLLQVPEDCPALIKNLIYACWNEKKNMRPCFTEICQQLQRLRDSPECLTESTYDRPHSQRISSVPMPPKISVMTPLTDATNFNPSASSPDSIYSCATANELKNSQSLNSRFDLNLNRSNRALVGDKYTF